MDALIDTNVLITYVTGREDPYKLSSVKIMEACSVGAINGYIAFSFAFNSLVCITKISGKSAAGLAYADSRSSECCWCG